MVREVEKLRTELEVFRFANPAVLCQREAFPNLLGLAIDENTAIVVRQDEFEVIGNSYVIIYDNQKQIPPQGAFYFLASGDRYNLATREAFRPATTMQPIGRVRKIAGQ
ncbi:MAG: hypothetical protein HY646_20855 [Acidobacteria bacterium]|nr:hypothetical protein [Acidobacteriota bacterium]